LETKIIQKKKKKKKNAQHIWLFLISKITQISPQQVVEEKCLRYHHRSCHHRQGNYNAPLFSNKSVKGRNWNFEKLMGAGNI